MCAFLYTHTTRLLVATYVFCTTRILVVAGDVAVPARCLYCVLLLLLLLLLILLLLYIYIYIYIYTATYVSSNTRMLQVTLK
jgi:hypothetical protein